MFGAEMNHGFWWQFVFKFSIMDWNYLPIGRVYLYPHTLSTYWQLFLLSNKLFTLSTFAVIFYKCHLKNFNYNTSADFDVIDDVNSCCCTLQNTDQACWLCTELSFPFTPHVCHILYHFRVHVLKEIENVFMKSDRSYGLAITCGWSRAFCHS